MPSLRRLAVPLTAVAASLTFAQAAQARSNQGQCTPSGSPIAFGAGFDWQYTTGNRVVIGSGGRTDNPNLSVSSLYVVDGNGTPQTYQQGVAYSGGNASPYVHYRVRYNPTGTYCDLNLPMDLYHGSPNDI